MYKGKLLVTNKKGGQGVRITYTKTQTEYTGASILGNCLNVLPHLQ